MTNPSESLTLMVLAAGIGSRFGGLKQIAPVGPSGEIVLDYSVFDARRAGFDRIVFVIRRDIERDFRAIADPHFGGRLAIAYAFQELGDLPAGFAAPPERKKPWGTAHAIYAARHHVTGPFAVVNADDFYGRRSFAMLASRLRELAGTRNRYALVGFALRNTLSENGTVARGVCATDNTGVLRRVTERLEIGRRDGAIAYRDGDRWEPLTGEETVSMNMWGFTPSIFEHLENGFLDFLRYLHQPDRAEYQIPTLIDHLIQTNRATVDVLPTPDAWLGVTYPQDLPTVRAGIGALVAAGDYPPRLWA